MTDVKSNLLKRKEDFENFIKSSVSEFIEELASSILFANEHGTKILVCGNGGSAAESSHFASELVVRYKNNRQSIAAISLCGDASIITAISNDFQYDDVFARQVEGLGDSGDILVAISTSGQSENIVEALKTAKKKGLLTFSLLGKDGGIAKNFADHCYIDNSHDTAIIQEHQLTIIHLICELIDDRMTK